MKKIIVLTVFVLGISLSATGQLNPGDKAVDFSLPNVDGTTVSLSDYSDENGVILIFTCIPCPYAQAYEQRIIDLHKEFAAKGYPVLAINSNDPSISKEDTFEGMKEHAKEKNYPFAYLKDKSNVFKEYGATRTPHIFLLQNDGDGTFSVAFIGAIDNNAMDENAVTKMYVKDAIHALENGSEPEPALVKAVGCTIKSKV